MQKKSGFVLTEVLIVLLVMGLLAIMAVPSFLHTRITTKAALCINNLRQIDKAIDRWVLEDNINVGTPITAQQEVVIYTYIRTGEPTCPSEGTYTMGIVGTHPQITCDIEGHTLDSE